MEKLIELLKLYLEGVTFLPANNGELQVIVQDPDDIPIVINTVAEVMHNYGYLENVQIITNISNLSVYITELD